ncbi:hypothetical protein Q7C36_009234 [Tachysurus vachellii]|uniref:Uncharacterized protein n=1 Tax=Tachysurus vachellii TaxID=175792 RepID=A0AA88N7E4_TACVA|nr:hypothetical protein Q7C36_009234 [Tachysurus vachellii]
MSPRSKTVTLHCVTLLRWYSSKSLRLDTARLSNRSLYRLGDGAVTRLALGGRRRPESAYVLNLLCELLSLSPFFATRIENKNAAQHPLTL